MRNIASPLDGISSPFLRRDFSPSSLFASGEDGAWYDPSNLATMFTDTAGTTAATAGDAVARIDDKSGNTANATQATTSARPILQQDADGQYYLQNDEIDDALTVTFPDMGAACTVAYVTASEVRLLEDQTISGAYTLPATDLYNIVIIDRALTFGEKVGVIRFLASKVDGVNYGAEIDRLTLIAINAVDVFVYDTSKDSDGGAWRIGALAQASSWYNETLNTSTRGSRREFPAVAVIVAEADKVTIYDGDDPSLPMWMVETPLASPTNNFTFWRPGGREVTGIFMTEGVLAFSVNSGNSSDGSSGLCWISFTSDRLGRYGEGVLGGGVATGVATFDRSSDLPTRNPEELVDRLVNDVAMTVLPDAPIDPATGLPVPTIVVATDGGVSVITDSGAVYDGVSTNTFAKVFISQDNYLYLLETTFADDIQAYGHLGDISADGFFTKAIYWEQTINAVRLSDDIINNAAWAGDKISAAAQGIRPALNLVYENRLAYTEGLAAYVSSTYNTGWMNGDIKGAFLSDTDDTDLVGSTPLEDDFSSSVDADWEIQDDWLNGTISGGEISVTTAPNFRGAARAFTTEIGKTYVITVEVSDVSGGLGRLYVGAANEPTVLALVNAANLGVGTHTRYFTAIATSHAVGLSTDNAEDTTVYTNVTVKLADEDRSVNNNGLVINGTVTRTFVDEV